VISLYFATMRLIKCCACHSSMLFDGSQVDVLVEEAVRDIGYYTRNAALFDYTVLATADDDDQGTGGPVDELGSILRQQQQASSRR